MQGTADMLCVKIKAIVSGTGSAECEIFVGLIMQYHYVSLDKFAVCVEQNAQSTRQKKF